jgi:serine/threonine protein kinase
VNKKQPEDLNTKAQSSDSSAGPIQTECVRFESAWKSGTRPKLEEFLAGWDEPERSKLLCELLLLELDFISADGETLAPQFYANRFPDHQDVIADVFSNWSSSRADDTLAEFGNTTLVMQSQFAELRMHAQGGLGVVYRAGERELSRDVAIKFIRSTLAENTDCRNRFRTEAEITSRLEHPGVVPVYGFGTGSDGNLFYAMRFIEGDTLDEAIGRYHDAKTKEATSRDTREFELRELLGRFVALCKTIAYAHNRGIVHRDIKPENVMLGRYGETIVIDWGLAIPVDRQGVFKQSGEQTLMPSSGSSSSTDTGGIAGTPAYMSPEQVSGRSELTPASDIYSLGVTLYKIMLGKVPFTGKLDQIWEGIREGNYEPPTKIDRSLSQALEAICAKAMSLHPRDRYTTALDLAGEIESYLADTPVTAFTEPISTRLARWSRRHRILSQGILVGLLLVTLVGVSAAIVFGRLQSNAVKSQQIEHGLRKHSLSLSAHFAARTMANNVDIRLRILEKEAADPLLRDYLVEINPDPQNREASQPLQDWMDKCGERYSHIDPRTWIIYAVDGTQVARYPSKDKNNQLSKTLFSNFAFRDYFNGKGEDEERGFQWPPLRESKFSVAMESRSSDQDLIVAFSTPIKDQTGDHVIGVIGMTVGLGKFADLNIDLPAGQKVLLVDTRQYYMRRNAKVDDQRKQSGEGLILHHEDLGDLKSRESLHRLDDATIQRLRSAKREWTSSESGQWMDNLLDADYHDPVAKKTDGPWLAAFAPVILTARQKDSKAYDTGCFVIVQQEHQPH